MVGGLLALLTVIILVVLVVFFLRRGQTKSKSSEQVMEMVEGLQVRM